MRLGKLPRLGILGGGQLARMTIQAAIPLGIDIVVLAEVENSPAGRLAQQEIVGHWNDEPTLRRFADAVDIVTLENEFVDAAVLAQLAAWDKIVRPGSQTLRLINDKLVQKQTLAAQGLPVPTFAAVEHPDELQHYGSSWGWPLVLKARRNGYDGYGNATLHSVDDIEAAIQRLGWPQRTLLVEQMVPFVRELAVLVARTADGAMAVYPVAETVQQRHICHLVRVPAPVSSAIIDKAVDLACAAVQAVDGVGITAVELFVTADEHVLINELAPRPHNSGHFSIDACITSQFENHVRAVLGLPLGDTTLRAGSVVMANLLGTRNGETQPRGLEQALSMTDVHVHLYGKHETRVGRKLGHVTALAPQLSDAEDAARRAADLITL